jgi:hypothetical protein
MTTSSITSRRSLHLVDLENLVGDPRAEAEPALSTLREYLDVGRWKPGDHVVLATNPWLMARIAFDVPVPANVHAVRGRDGADTMLLAQSPPELVVKRYARLVVGSGDGIFVGRAEAALDYGVIVDVVARADGCSATLRRFDCTFLAPRATDVVLAA